MFITKTLATTLRLLARLRRISWVLCCCLQVLHGLCLQHLMLDGEDDGGGGHAGMEACDDTGLFDGGGPTHSSSAWA